MKIKKIYEIIQAVITLLAMMFSIFATYVAFGLSNYRLGFTYLFISFGLLLFVHYDYKYFIKGESDESRRK